MEKDRKKISVDFSIKAAWLSISKMYNMLGADYDISHSTGFVLLNIDRDHGTPATKIAPLLGMESRSLTRMLKTLEEKKLISRTADDNDKRKVIIRLTEEGKIKREMSRQTVKAFQRRVNELVDTEDLATFFNVLDTIHTIANEAEHTILSEVQKQMLELKAS
jgi:DNA-binding MarR family transcriptional regulator